MMNKKKMAASAMAAMLTAGMALAPAADVKAADQAEYSKTENVYVRMDSEGDVSGTYVVNSFTVTDAGEITDYGKYDSIQNLTNLDAIETDKEEHTFYAEKGKFYYQGNMDNAQLPWNFDIRYILDGKEVDAEDLAGAEGDLEIHMTVKENSAASDPAFYQAYLLQVSFTLDNALCEDITAPGANMADAGGNQQITFTVMPDMAAHGQGSQPEGTSESSEGTPESSEGAAESPEGAAESPEGAAESSEETSDRSQGDGKSPDNDVKKKAADQETELVVTASVKDFEMGDISINGAAMSDFPVSFVSDENRETRQTMFIMSVEGITIPEEIVEEETVVDDRNFFEKLIDKIRNHAKE